AQSAPSVVDYRESLGQGLVTLASWQHKMRELDKEEQSWREARDVYQGLAAEYSKTQYRGSPANCHYRLGTLLGMLDVSRFGKESEETLRQAEELYQQLVNEFGGVEGYRESLAKTYHNQGMLFSTTGRPAEAERAFRHEVAVWERLAAEFP